MTFLLLNQGISRFDPRFQIYLSPAPALNSGYSFFSWVRLPAAPAAGFFPVASNVLSGSFNSGFHFHAGTSVDADALRVLLFKSTVEAHIVKTDGAVLVREQWTHVGFTYDKDAGTER